MRMENGTGTVSKLSGKRRKPYVAKKFVGWKVDDENRKATPIYRSIGTFAKKSEAYKALINADKIPAEREDRITLERVYEEWSARHYDTISDSTASQYRNAWSYLERLHKGDIRKLKTSDYESTVEKANPPRTVRANIKIVLKQLYKYAIAHEYCEKDYSELVDLGGDKTSQIVRKVFSVGEVDALFDRDDVIADVLLVGIFTGMRPNELLDLKVSEVDLDHGFLRIHGSKTKSGFLRTIPIHARILPIIQRNCLKSANFGVTRVFTTDGKHPLMYETLRKQMVGHLPHDTRHSFVTYARRSGMDSLIVKRIVGHSSGSNVTEKVYTHTDNDDLRKEMDKFVVA